jgi:excisionase family DNA binding protein
MAKKKRTPCGQPAKLMAMDMATETERELVGTSEAAEILGVGVGYLRQLAREGEIWSDHRFGKRCPVYDAVELRERAEAIAAERAAGTRPGRPPTGKKG